MKPAGHNFFGKRVNDDGSGNIILKNKTTPPLDLFFIQPIAGAVTTLSSNVSVGDITCVLTNASNFSIGDRFGAFSGASGEDRFYFSQILNKVTNTLTFDTPFDFAFEAGDSALGFTRDMNVDGSSTMQIFSVNAPPGMSSPLNLDITRLIVQIVDGTAMDDGLFGSLAALTNGLVLRRNNLEMNNIFNVKTNGDIANLSFDSRYPDKAPAGQFAFTARMSFAGQDKHGSSFRLVPGDALELLIQDNLSTLNLFRVIAQGNIVQK